MSTKEIYLKPEDWKELFSHFGGVLSPRKMMQDGIDRTFDFGENLKTIMTTRPNVAITIHENVETILKELLREYGIEKEFNSFLIVVQYAPDFSDAGLKVQKKYNQKLKKALDAYIALMSPGDSKVSVGGKRIELDPIFDEHIRLASVKSLESRLSIYQRHYWSGAGLHIDLTDEAGRISLNKALSHSDGLRRNKKTVKHTEQLRDYATAIFNFLPDTSFASRNQKFAFIGKFFTDVVPIFERCESAYHDLGKSLVFPSSVRI